MQLNSKHNATKHKFCSVLFTKNFVPGKTLPTGHVNACSHASHRTYGRRFAFHHEESLKYNVGAATSVVLLQKTG